MKKKITSILLKYEINNEYHFIGECGDCGAELTVTNISVHCNTIYIQVAPCEACKERLLKESQSEND